MIHSRRLMSTATTNPSELLAASLAALSKSAYQVFAEIENKARSEVARATADAHEARAERDKAIEELHASQLEGHAWKQETISCKAALKQAEITITHQTETTAQLRREANQWKDQSRNWQEHFLRVEQERCALSTRANELVAERLQWSRPVPSAPFTPKHQSSNMTDSAPSSTTTKRASTSSLNQPPAYKSARPASPSGLDSPSASTSISNHKPLRSVPKPLKRSRHKAQPSGELPPYELPSDIVPKAQSLSSDISAARTRQEPRQTLIRRVQAVIHVKREESDDESVDAESKEEETKDVALQAKSPANQRRKRKSVVYDDDDEYVSGEDRHYTGGGRRDEENDSGEDEGYEKPSESDDEDDELMMGAEENHHELYGTRRIKASFKSNHSPEEPPSPTKKRKLAVPTPREKPPVRRKL